MVVVPEGQHIERVPKAHRVFVLARGELSAFHPWLNLGSAFCRLIPILVGNPLRAMVLRRFGWNIGRGTYFAGTPALRGPGRIQDRLRIGPENVINVGCTFELNADVTTGERVSIGPDVMFLTSSHRIGSPYRRSGVTKTAPIRVGSGAWVGARCLILPGVTIGEGAVIAAGSVVSRDVKPHSLVGGTPAQVLVDRLPLR